MNSNLKRDLNIQVDNHSDLTRTGVTETGLLKTSRGLVITEQAKSQLSSMRPSSETAAAVVAAAGQRRKRRRKPADNTVNVTVTLASIGSFPAVYHHMYPGEGVLVLGLDEHSYRPAETSRGADGKLENTISLDRFPGLTYAFAGNSFIDADGVRNIILIEVKNG